jgi:hypothetical protein
VSEKRTREAEGGFMAVEVSRGVAAGLAAADVAENFVEAGSLRGLRRSRSPRRSPAMTVTELSYTGLEPCGSCSSATWTLRSGYIVVVLPDGTIAGRLQVPFLPFEAGYLRPSRFTDEP